MRQVAVLLMIGLSSAAFGTSKAYDVVPFGGSVSQTTTTPNEVVQYLVNTLDSITDVSVWLGPPSTSGSYQVEVYDSMVRIAYGTMDPTPYWGWVDFPMTKYAKPARGRTYLVEVSRPQGAAISYAYDPRETTYAYGCLVVGNQAHPTEDLAAMTAA